MHGGLSPACIPGTVFTHKDYHRFWLVDSSAVASILTQYILRVSSDFWFVGSGFYMIPFHYIVIVVVGWGVSMSLWGCGLYLVRCHPPEWWVGATEALVCWFVVNWQRKMELQEKPLSDPPHELLWNRLRFSAVASRWLIAPRAACSLHMPFEFRFPQ